MIRKSNQSPNHMNTPFDTRTFRVGYAMEMCLPCLTIRSAKYPILNAHRKVFSI